MKARFWLTFAFIGVATAQVKPKDVYGWGKIKWGMTIRQAKAALGADVRESDGKPRESTKYVARLVIDKFKIGDTELKIEIDTLPSSDKIQHVEMELPDGVSETNGDYSSLQNALTLKYGSPTRQKSKKDGDMEVDSATWVFPSTVINILWIRLTDIRFETLTLVYDATDKKAQDSL